jgi:hypothetical protein
VARFNGRSTATLFAHVRRNQYTFHILVRDDPPKKLRGRVTISQRLGVFIQKIKPKRQRTVTPSQPSPSAGNSLFVFNSLGIFRYK